MFKQIFAASLFTTFALTIILVTATNAKAQSSTSCDNNLQEYFLGTQLNAAKWDYFNVGDVKTTATDVVQNYRLIINRQNAISGIDGIITKKEYTGNFRAEMDVSYFQTFYPDTDSNKNAQIVLSAYTSPDNRFAIVWGKSITSSFVYGVNIKDGQVAKETEKYELDPYLYTRLILIRRSTDAELLMQVGGKEVPIGKFKDVFAGPVKLAVYVNGGGSSNQTITAVIDNLTTKCDLDNTPVSFVTDTFINPGSGTTLVADLANMIPYFVADTAFSFGLGFLIAKAAFHGNRPD